MIRIINPKILFVASLIAFVLFFVVPVPALAANATFFGPIVPPECHCDTLNGNAVNSAPDYGCVLQTVQNSLNFTISMACILFALYLAYAGFRMITAGSGAEMISQARSRLFNVVIGLAVVLCSWLIVDYVMKNLYNEGSFGPWNAILTNDSKATRCIVVKESQSIVTGSATGATSGTSTGAAAGGTYTGGGFTYQSGVERQVSDESSALGSLLSCMATHVPAGVGQISAISENAIAAGSKTMAQCASSGSCAHTANSCHYGGKLCVGKSYAVDFGDEGNATALRDAARTCNSNAKWNYEGNHVHISVGSASGCACDDGLGSI